MRAISTTIFPAASEPIIHPNHRAPSKRTLAKFAVLAAGWPVTPEQWRTRRISIWATDKAFQAIELLRAVHFDMALVRSRWDDSSPWPFVRRMRLVRPDLKWALVAETLDGRDEIMARSLGAWRVMSHRTNADDLEEILTRTLSPARAGAVTAAAPRHQPPISTDVHERQQTNRSNVLLHGN